MGAEGSVLCGLNLIQPTRGASVRGLSDLPQPEPSPFLLAVGGRAFHPWAQSSEWRGEKARGLRRVSKPRLHLCWPVSRPPLAPPARILGALFRLYIFPLWLPLGLGNQARAPWVVSAWKRHYHENVCCSSGSPAGQHLKYPLAAVSSTKQCHRLRWACLVCRLLA